MQATIEELRQVLKEYVFKLNTISESEMSARSLPGKWSKKEVIGHLIDSASNNLRRFICGQYETDPKIIYDQNAWVNSNVYHQADSKDLVMLWKLENERIIAVLQSMPATNYEKTCDTGKGEVSLHSIHWLAADYVKHLKHHITQIIPNSFDIAYS